MSDEPDIVDSYRRLFGALGDMDENALESLSEAIEATGERVPLDERIDMLRSFQVQFSDRHEFRPGQLVTWKPGLKNKRLPRIGEPAIVIDVLSEPNFPDKDPATTYYREPLDLVLALVDEEKDVLVYHFDSRRFMPFGEAER